MLRKIMEWFTGNALPIAFVAGCAAGGVVAGWAAFEVGERLGARAALASCIKQSELNDLQRQLDEARRDREASRIAADAQRENAVANARMAMEAQEQLEEYRHELPRLAEIPLSNDTVPDEKPLDLSCRGSRPVDHQRLWPRPAKADPRH